MDYFSPHMSLNEVNAISMLGLAHIGDGVYELLTRTMLCTQGHSAVQKLHRLTVSYVNAPAQAAAAPRNPRPSRPATASSPPVGITAP